MATIVRKYKPKSYSLEKSVDSNFIHAEKLAKITAQNVEQAKKVLKEARKIQNQRDSENGMKSIAIVSLFLLAGCTQKPQPKVVQGPVVTTTTHSAEVPESQLTDKQKIALLRKEAKARGLRWYVHCLPTDDGEDYFLAVAWPKDAANTDVIEDGGKGMWIYFEKVTQADAAYGLYQSIQQPMTHPPEHRKLEKPVWHKHCPPGLHGD